MIRFVADDGTQACSVRRLRNAVCYWNYTNHQPSSTQAVQCKYDNYCNVYSFVSLTLFMRVEQLCST